MNGTNGHFSFYNTEDCASKMFTNEGATSFYLGITAATVKFLSTAALQTVLLSLYFQMKKATSSFWLCDSLVNENYLHLQKIP